MLNFVHLQTEENKHIKNNQSSMSENLLLTTEFIELHPLVKVHVLLFTCKILIIFFVQNFVIDEIYNGNITNITGLKSCCNVYGGALALAGKDVAKAQEYSKGKRKKKTKT